MRLLRDCLILAALTGGLVGSGLTQETSVSEYGLKAVLLHKLPQFIYRTQKNTASAMKICILGGNPFGDALEKLLHQAGQNPQSELRTISGTHQVSGCDLVFIHRGEADRLDFILQRLSLRGLVTVSDIAGFSRAGGMVEFSLSGERPGVHILINRRAAQQQGIEFNAQLLRLATLVEP